MFKKNQNQEVILKPVSGKKLVVFETEQISVFKRKNKPPYIDLRPYQKRNKKKGKK